MKRITLIKFVAVALMFSGSAVHAGEDEQDLTTEQFRTPSRNIYCVYNQNEKSLECERLKPRYVVFHLDTHNSKTANYIAELRYSYDNRAGSFELGYDEAWNSNDNQLHCSSSQSGLKCYNNAKHGFILSKKVVRNF
jgi:hypothetical protein